MAATKIQKRNAERKVIQFPSEGGPANTLRQLDLAEERLLTRQFIEAREALQRNRQMIRAAVEQGFQLEPGTRAARISTRRMLIVR